MIAIFSAGRIGVDRSQQGQRLGEQLLIDAIYRSVLVAQQISAIGLFVDGMSPQIAPFYQQYGFSPAVVDDHSRLEMWLPITTCVEIVGNLL
ncbi:MAG: GNAT family N-acetyltransferase [Halioglobus sp.]